ncbi:hypothetical protein [Caballeronia ptereochthonis]|uniref:Uncharacterized protein n=1 Tax=Caballeronia ptereochthonis TaxID=1777144 RepID=A0A158DGT1_9BURK|nr:hypothetical protein [Caballeronia ptereochthonis]SAK93842.1 hypothetical protein AWB83_05446 [Caballeronia ptereochthonis]
MTHTLTPSFEPAPMARRPAERRPQAAHIRRRDAVAAVAAISMALAFWAPSAMAQPDASDAPSGERRIVAPATTDPLVTRRNATAQANAEYRASRQLSKDERRAAVAEANARYKEEVANARINRKADHAAASIALKATELDQPSAPNRSH